MPKPDKDTVEYHVHVHQSDSQLAAAIGALIETVETAVPTIIGAIEQLGADMATDLTRITSEVEETRTVLDGAIALIVNLAQLLRDAASGGGDVTAEVNALADSLDAKQAELAAAIEANTPAAEPPA